MLTKNASTAPFTHPDRYTRGTDAAMYTTLGLPVPSEPDPTPIARYEECDHCGGTCEVYSRRCPTCKGKGIIRVTDKAAQS